MYKMSKHTKRFIDTRQPRRTLNEDNSTKIQVFFKHN